MSYTDFLRQKIKLASFNGFDVPPEQINPALAPHTRDIAHWAVQGGNRAIFASFGLHKTATQIEIMRLIGQHRAGIRGITTHDILRRCARQSVGLPAQATEAA